jgi:hypothetical protein
LAWIAGRNAVIYLGIASAAAAASPLMFQAKVTFNSASDKIEVTAFGDTSKVYVGGLPDSSGTMAGFYDDASAQTYTASQDGQARKMYIYPSSLTVTQYFFGTAIVDFSLDLGVSDAGTTSASFSAATPFAKVG